MRLFCLCFVFFVVLLFCFFGCVLEFDLGVYGSMDDLCNVQMLDLVDQVLKGNMVVVLVVDVMLYKFLSDVLIMIQWMLMVIWEYEKDLKVIFGCKFQINVLQWKFDEIYLFKVFEVYILLFGKYLLIGGDDYQIYGLFDQVGVCGGLFGLGYGVNGIVYLFFELYCEYYWEEVWKDVIYGSEIKIEKVCIVVYVVLGVCVSWGEQ